MSRVDGPEFRSPEELKRGWRVCYKMHDGSVMAEQERSYGECAARADEVRAKGLARGGRVEISRTGQPFTPDGKWV